MYTWVKPQTSADEFGRPPLQSPELARGGSVSHLIAGQEL